MQHRAEPGPYRNRLRVDGTFQLELAFCNDHGIPHSVFLSWDPVDRAKALAYLVEKGQACDLCGTAEWEWEENRRAYTPVEHFCMGCYLKAALQEETSNMPGTTVRLASSSSQAAAERLVKLKKRSGGMRGGQ